ncbi:MAG: DUF502 domain-containing protein [Desulfobacterales bacterium]
MNKMKTFIKTSLVGGLAVILPAVLLILIFRWLFNWVTDIIQPLTNMVLARGEFQEFVADAIVIVIILTICFMVGTIVRTKVGRYIQENLENRILQIAPGYPTIKSVVMQFIGKKKSPFSSVALVRPFENDTLMTAFITDTHEKNRSTVFVPTGPNPTTGFIFHLQKQFVHPIDISVEEAFRSVISCGAGSANFLQGLGEIKSD